MLRLSGQDGEVAAHDIRFVGGHVDDDVPVPAGQFFQLTGPVTNDRFGAGIQARVSAARLKSVTVSPRPSAASTIARPRKRVPPRMRTCISFATPDIYVRARGRD
jgi:hypothetical protein